MRHRLLWCATLVLGSAIAFACAWDRDTLAAEAKGLPRVADVIGGRFDRNPPLYYEMRLDRALKAIEADSEDFIAYGDAAIALDKLGRANEAVVILEKRLKEFEFRSYSDPNKDEGEHLYQLYANLGTVRAHDWVRRGADAKDTTDLVQAIGEIERAIEINPDAHFGREFVQLALMKMVLADKLGDREAVKTEMTKLKGKEGWDINHAHAQKVIEGTCGMIALGAGWEGPDMFRVLARLLTLEENGVLAELALKREAELLSQGRRSGFSEHVRQNELKSYPMIEDKRRGEIDQYFAALRKNGDDYHNNRTEFMLSKLKAGEHPDTHRGFWDGYVEVPPLDLGAIDKRLQAERRNKAISLALPAIGIGLGCAIVLVGAVVRRRRRNSA